MIVGDRMMSLAKLVYHRREEDDIELPLILFLGAGCAEAAGVPSVQKIALDVFTELFAKDPDTAVKYFSSVQELEAFRADPPSANQETLLRAFYTYLRSMSRIGRYSTLQRFYAQVPVPLFYQNLARLIRDGYFRRVLTTNIDTLLEKALDSVEMYRSAQYEVVNLGAYGAPSAEVQPDPDLEAPVTIVKLHGDVGESDGIAAISPREIADLLKPQRTMVKDELSGDIVMVGYSFESRPLEEWLTYTSGGIWWVSPERPDPARLDKLDWSRRQMEFVDGPEAHPSRFFAALQAGIQAAAGGFEQAEGEFSASVGLELATQETSGSLAPDATSKIASLQEQLRGHQSNLASLQQQLMMTSQPDLQVQLDYERDRVADIENQLRALLYDPARVQKTMNSLATSAGRANLSPGVVTFFRRQARAVHDEYRRTQPDQDVIAAALAAVVMLADRQDPPAANATVIEELKAMASGAEARRDQ